MSTLSSTISSSICFGLADRVCVVTGGAQGIGEACIRRFARENPRLSCADTHDVRAALCRSSWRATSA